MVVLSTGMIAFLCSITIGAAILIILYCLCRSTDPLLDHTCRAWLHHPRIESKGKHSYDTLPLHESTQEDKFGTLEKIRVEENREKPKIRGVGVVKSKFYEGNSEKCPLSFSEPDFNRNESLNKERRKTAPRGGRNRARQHHSRSREYLDPKAKSVHDIYVNEQTNASSPSKEYNIDRRDKRGYPSRSLGFIDKYDEQHVEGTSSLYLYPSPLKSKDISNHYVRPRSLERDVGDERDRKRESLRFSSHYVRPRSLEREYRQDSHYSSSHYVRPRSLDRDVKDEREIKREISSSHYVHPRSLEGRKDSHRSSSHNVTDSLYVYPRSAAQDAISHRNEKSKQDKHVTRSKDYSQDNYYHNITTSRDKAPLLQDSEEITVSQMQQLSSEVIPRKEMLHKHDRDQQHQCRSKREDRDRAKIKGKRDEKEQSGPQMRDGGERQSRPRSRSATEYRKRSHELDDGWCDHKKREKESYFLPRTQSVTSARPPNNTASSLARRHTIHLEFHPRSGDVTPMNSDTSIKPTSIKPDYRSREQIELSPKRAVKREDGMRGGQPRVYETNRDTNRHLQNDYSEKSPLVEPEKTKGERRRVGNDDDEGFTIPPRYDSLPDAHRDREQKQRSQSENRKDKRRGPSEDMRGFTIPPRYDSLSDRYGDTTHKSRPVNGEKGHGQPPKEMDFSAGHNTSSQKSLPVSKDTKQRLEKGPAQYVDPNKDHSVSYQKRGLITDNKQGEPRITGKGNQRLEGTKEPSRKMDRMTDGEKITDPDRGPKRGHNDNRFTAKEFIIENHPKLRPRKSTESTSSEATMENIHREIRSSSIYKTTEDDRLVLRDTSQEEREKLIREPCQDQQTKRTIVPPKRKKSIERLFYVKSVPRSEPTIDFEESAEVSQDIDWQLLALDGKTPTQDPHPEGDEVTENKQLTLNNPIPSKVLSDKNIDWNLFTLTGDKVDTKEDEKKSIVNSHLEEVDGQTAARHQPTSGDVKHSKVTNQRNIDWNVFTTTGEKMEKVTPTEHETMMKQDEGQLYTTSTTESIKYSLETQIKYGKELRKPDENSLPRKPRIKPTILTFE